MSEIVIFDIDGTIFNPEVFGRKIRSRFVDILKIAEEELMRANADYYSGLETTTDFNPNDIVAFLADRFSVDGKLLEKVFWEEDDIYRDSIFEESSDVLDALSREKILGVYSQGFEDLQKRKLAASGLDRYFTREYMYFHRRKITDEAISLLPRGSMVVDDNHDVVVKLPQSVAAVWMNRRTSDIDARFRTIHNLRELLTP